MYQTARVAIQTIERDAVRPGFDAPYFRVTFELRAEGIPASDMTIWVHAAYPESEVTAVAHTFLAQRLADLAEAASEAAMPREAVEQLWDTVKPANGL